MVTSSKPSASLDPLSAYETADAALRRGPVTPDLQKAAVLALARGGAVELALDRFAEYGLAAQKGDEDALALKGRLLKDRAMAACGNARQAALRESAEAYFHAFALTKGTYSGINAATLYTLSGKPDQGARIASGVLEIVRSRPASSVPEANYFNYATLAEAFLLLGKRERAAATLADAIEADPQNYTAHATTLHQFQRILTYHGWEAAWLDPFRPPRPTFFAGRMPGPDGILTDEARLTEAIAQQVKIQRILSGYGALAAGADILFAEALMSANRPLHIVLPCDIDAFEARSVRPSGESWVRRFRTCLDHAASLTLATRDNSLDSTLAIEHAAYYAMGAAIVRAEQLATEALQVQIAPRSGSLTALWTEAWTTSKRASAPLVIATESTREPFTKRPAPTSENRRLVSILFADLAGFGQLPDADVLTVIEKIMHPLAKTLQAMAGPPQHVNSWGDGIFAVFANAPDAALAALALQAQMQQLSIPHIQKKAQLALRIGLHCGPVTFARDPITHTINVYGSQVTYAARIEPLAIPGSILASDAFAAALALAPRCEAQTHYIGRRTLKNIDKAVRLHMVTSAPH